MRPLRYFVVTYQGMVSMILLEIGTEGVELDSPSRFADRSSRHICSVSRRRALLIRRYPYMHLLPAKHAVDTREPAFHLGRAETMSAMHSKVWSIVH